VLIEFVRYREFRFELKADQQWGGYRYAAYIFAKGQKPKGIDLGDRQFVGSMCSLLRRDLDQADPQQIGARANQVYRAIFAKIEPHLRGATRGAPVIPN
jgi:hypothetical protein